MTEAEILKQTADKLRTIADSLESEAKMKRQDLSRLSTRAKNVLLFAQQHYGRDLSKLTNEELLHVRNCGKKTIAELRAWQG